MSARGTYHPEHRDRRALRRDIRRALQRTIVMLTGTGEFKQADSARGVLSRLSRTADHDNFMAILDATLNTETT